MSAKIDTLNMTRLLLGSHYEFHNRTNMLITEATPAALMIDDLAPQYVAEVKVLLEVVNRARGNQLSLQIAELDDKRDGLVGEIFSTIDHAATSQIATRKEMGRKMEYAIKPYRGITGNEYTKETAQIRGLLRDIGTDEMVDIQDALGIALLVQELRKTNNQLAQIMGDRADDNATRADITNIDSRQQRKTVDDIYRAIVEKVNAVAILMPSEAVSKFIERQNGNIVQFKNILSHQQAGGTGNEKGTGGKEEEETIDN